MAYRAYLQRGSNRLYLDTAPYELAHGFVPPAISEIPNIASGTSANQYGGGKLIDKRADSAPYSFSVRVMGNSNAHNEALVDRLDRFLRSGTEAEPVYFCWRPADVVDYEPLYGQWNATRRAKVITGSVFKSAQYYGENIRTIVLFADVNLIINPPEGKRQRVATATGGIIEDTIGTPDGISRGVIVAEATTNVITNPIFGHATPLTSWTTGADLIGEVVTDTDFVLFGSNAVRLTRKTSGSTFSFYQSINVGNTNTWCLSFYAKKPDGSAVTASDVRPRYGSTTPSDSTYVAVGNGWYRVYDTFTGIASSQVVGCTPIVSGGAIYVDGFQLEEKAYPTPLAYGDLLGCAWSSTAHNSSTTRTVSSLRVPASECVVPNQFTWWIAFRANCTFSEFSTARVLLREDATNAYINAETTGQLSFSYDGTNGCSGAATAITAGQVVIVHATMNAAGMQIYRNGAADGAGTASYAPLASPTYLYVGSNETPGGHSNATILGAGTYNRAMTAAEVAADYANMYQAAIGLDTYGARVDWVPYLWTNGGDDVVDFYNSATLKNYGMVASVSGDLPAITEFEISITTESFKYNSAGGVLLSCFDVPHKMSVLGVDSLFLDYSGTVVAGRVGGQVYTVAVGTAFESPASSMSITDHETITQLKQKGYYLCGVMDDAGSGLSLRASIYDAGVSYRTDWVPFSDVTGYRVAVFGGVSQSRVSPWINRGLTENVYEEILQPIPHVIRASASANVSFDFVQIMPRPFMRLFGEDGVDSTMPMAVYHSEHGTFGRVTTSNYIIDAVKTTGDKIAFIPGRSNFLISLCGDPYLSDVAEVAITETLTYSRVYITPRWALA